MMQGHAMDEAPEVGEVGCVIEKARSETRNGLFFPL